MWQFTLRNDRRKQNRKLPEIAIFDTDGNPVEFGGGSVDWSTPIPELHFTGDLTDDTSGMNIVWDEDLWGLVFKGPPGSGDAELYLVDPDDPDGNQTNLWPGSSSFRGADGVHASYGSNQASISGPYGTTSINTGGASFYGLGEGGVNISAGGAGFYADQAMFVGDELIKRRYFSFGYNDESGSRFSITPDGELGWNDGSSFIYPDVTLERIAPGTLELDNTLSFKNTDGVSSGGPSMVYGDSEQWGADYSVLSILGLSDGEFDVLDTTICAVASDGSTFASIGSNGTLQLRSSTGAAVFSCPTDNVFEIVGPSGGLVARSPDGTRYKLTPPNGGGAATWVAA